MKRSFYPIGISLFVLVVAISGCAGTRSIKKIDQFAANGIAFADSIVPLIDESFAMAVSADSLVLARAREAVVDPETRGAQLKQSDRQLRARLEILRDLKRHAALLRSYFTAIKAIVQTKAASGIAAGTKGLVGQMSKLEPQIAAAAIGGSPVSDFIEPAVKLAVAAYQNKALHQELSARADAIDREIALQAAVLTALYEQMRADKALEIQDKEKTISSAYTEQGRLPRNWSKQRVDAFRMAIGIDAYEDAAKAAKALRQSWQALVEKRLGSPSLFELTQLTKKLVALAQKIEADHH